MNFIFSFVFSFDEMENHNDANDIVLVNIDAKSRLWMFWTSLVMKHFHRLRPKYLSVIVDFCVLSKGCDIVGETYNWLGYNTKQPLSFVIFENQK